MRNIFLHIGFPKAASTTLQQDFFAKHEEILYLGAPFFNEKIRNIVEVDIERKDRIEFDSKVVRKVLEEEISKRGKEPADKAILLSKESFSITIDNSRDRVLLAEKLFNIFGAAKIIIVIRNQFSFLSSKYIEGVKGGMYISFPDFLKESWNDFHRSLFPQLKYYEFIDVYNRIFGEENVLVLCFEDLKNRPSQFLIQLCQFMGIQNRIQILPARNRALSRQTLFMRRILNRIVTYDSGRPVFTPRMRVPGGSPDLKNFRYLYKVGTLRVLNIIDAVCGLKGAKLAFSEEWVKKIQGLYASSNRNLAKKYNLPLGVYNYPMNDNSGSKTHG